MNVKEPEFSIRLSNLLNMSLEEENKEYIKQVIRKIGLEHFKVIVDEFNLKILNSISDGSFKNNEEIVTSLASNKKF